MTPVVDDDLIFISSAYFKSGSVLLRVREDGKGVDEVWRGLQLEMHWARPILSGGHLFAFSGRNEPDAIFRCVEFRTGKLKWERPEGWPNAGHAKLEEGERPPNVFGRGSLILADGKLIVLAKQGCSVSFGRIQTKLRSYRAGRCLACVIRVGPDQSLRTSAFISAAKSASFVTIWESDAPTVHPPSSDISAL
jgi:hypothetical protein